MDIAGKVFIVTGGASGLGEGSARMLAANGGKVLIADMQVEKGEAIAGHSLQCRVVVFQADDRRPFVVTVRKIILSAWAGQVFHELHRIRRVFTVPGDACAG